MLISSLIGGSVVCGFKHGLRLYCLYKKVDLMSSGIHLNSIVDACKKKSYFLIKFKSDKYDHDQIESAKVW